MKRIEEREKLLRDGRIGLESYQHENASPSLAEEVVRATDEELGQLIAGSGSVRLLRASTRRSR